MEELITFFRPLFKELVAEAIKQMKAEAEKERAAEEPRYYKRDEVAKMLHISLPTLWKLTQEGTLKAQRVRGRVLYEAQAIKELVATGNIKYNRKRL